MQLSTFNPSQIFLLLKSCPLKQKKVQKIITKLTNAFPIQVIEDTQIYSDLSNDAKNTGKQLL